MSDIIVTPQGVPTPILGLVKPAVDGDLDIWGDLTNANWDILDHALVNSAGTVQITAPAATHQWIMLNRDAGQEAGIFATTNGLARWFLKMADGSAEPGGGLNQGSDWSLNRYDDSGNFVDTPILIRRGTGNIRFTSCVGIDAAIPPDMTRGAGYKSLLVSGVVIADNHSYNLYLDTDFAWRYLKAATGFALTSGPNGAALYVAPVGTPDTLVAAFATPFTFTPGGNFGLAITPPAAQSHASPYVGGWLFAWGMTVQNWAQNIYFDGSEWRYWQSNAAAQLLQQGDFGWFWMSAPVGTADAIATLTQKMWLSTAGELNTQGGVKAGYAGVGAIRLSPADATHTGYLEFFNAAGTREGYFGFANGGILNLTLEDATSTFQINGAVSVSGSNGQLTAAVGITSNGNVVARGNLYAAYGTAANFCMFGNASYLMQQYEGNWYWQWNRSTGQLAWIGNGAWIFGIEPGGVLNVLGGDRSICPLAGSSYLTINGSTVFAGGANFIVNGGGRPTYAFEWYWATNRIGSMDTSGNLAVNQALQAGGGVAVRGGASWFSAGGAGVQLVFQAGWSLDWNVGDGNLGWLTPNGYLLQMRTLDNLIWNNAGAVAGYGAYQDLSDVRAKQSVAPATAGLAEILQLEPINFIRISHPVPAGATLPDGSAIPLVIHPPEIGFSAQQVRPVLPEAVRVVGIELPDGSGDLKSDEPSLAIIGTVILAALVNAAKEMHARLVALETAGAA